MTSYQRSDPMPENAPKDLRASTLSISAARRMIFAMIVLAIMWGLIAWAVALP